MNNLQQLIKITLNGNLIEVKPGMTVAAAIISFGASTTRKSVNGSARGPLCGMGICYECRVTINGNEHSRSCMILCEEGMEVVHV